MSESINPIVRTVLPLLLVLQLCFPFLHLCLEGECGTAAGLHGSHTAHVHESSDLACLQSVEGPCQDIRFELDGSTPLHPSGRGQILAPLPFQSGNLDLRFNSLSALASPLRSAEPVATAPLDLQRRNPILRS